MLKVYETSILCPKCKTSIPLTESLAKPFVESARREFELALEKRDEEIAAKEAQLAEERDGLARGRRSLEHTISIGVAKRIEVERKRIEAEVVEHARISLAAELSARDRKLTALESANDALGRKLAASQTSELELEKQRRQLEAQVAEQDLVVERRVHDAMAPLRIELARQAKERALLSVRERDMIIEQLRNQIDDLKQRVDQGSQQLQGEAQELLIEDLLAKHFRFDRISPVAKGEAGGDLVQHVVGSTSQVVGSILWESKRTKHWNDEWLTKVRADQRRAGADVAVIVSRAMPKGITTFDLIEGVWVVSSSLALPVATMLRQAILKIASVQAAVDGQQTKAELLYQYLTGKGFSARLTALAEAFQGIRMELESERKLLLRQWAKREQQLRSVEGALMGFIGDVEGIAGHDLKGMEALDSVALTGEIDCEGDLQRSA